MKLKINSPELRNLPWQERPADSLETVWRYTENPIIGRRGTPTSNSIFNSAAVPYKDGFALRLQFRRNPLGHQPRTVHGGTGRSGGGNAYIRL